MNALIIYLLKYWNGKLPLSSAFLFVFIPVSVAWYVIKYFAKSGITDDYVSIYHPMIIFPLFMGVTISIYRFIGLWRCAKNTERKLLKIGAQIIALTFFIPSMLGATLLTYGLISNLF